MELIKQLVRLSVNEIKMAKELKEYDILHCHLFLWEDMTLEQRLIAAYKTAKKVLEDDFDLSPVEIVALNFLVILAGQTLIDNSMLLMPKMAMPTTKPKGMPKDVENKELLLANKFFS